jgi:hypothetical protein
MKLTTHQHAVMIFEKDTAVLSCSVCIRMSFFKNEKTGVLR